MKQSMFVGDEFTTKEGERITIVDYISARDVTVEFDCGFRKKSNASNIRTGSVSYPFKRNVYGVGYRGYGNHATKHNGVQNPAYECWKGMLRRCYSKESQIKNPSYVGCTVADEWHDYQNFADWYYQNYIDGFYIDKDLRVKWNSIYSPEFCSFVPFEINVLFTDRRSERGSLPIGVSKSGNKYFAYISKGNRQHRKLGYFDTIEDAFICYKQEKEKVSSLLAEKYKDQIHPDVYNNLKNWDVEPFPEINRI